MLLNVGDILDNRYEILSRIGQGGMATVYKARDLRLDRVVAVKMLRDEFSTDEEFIDRFKNEARSAARLTHNNIVAAYDIVSSLDKHYIVMEFVEGITLKDYISRKGKLSNKETIGIAIQTAEGLCEAHKNNIIHRDIKSQNIIISKEGKIKIADFGIAKAVTGEDDPGNSVIGSAHYISPEQAQNGVADARSDLYSLGISMYEMITGRLPYEGENTVNVVMSHIQDAMVPPSVYNSEIYPALNDIIIKLTRKDPEERYQTSAELIEDLKHAAAEPEGHFVRMYDSVASGSHETDKQKDSSMDVPADNEADDTVIDEDNEKEDIFDNSKNRFIILGITAFVIALAAVIIVFIIKSGSDAMKNAELNSSAVSSEASESESEMNYTLSIQGEAVMPDLVGMKVSEAETALSSLNITLDSSNENYSEEYPQGVIINQSPSKDEVLTPDSTVYVTVSMGSVLDNISNRTYEEARTMLEEAGFVVEDETFEDFSDDVPEGLVCNYTEANEMRDGKRVIALILSRGPKSDYVNMPDIVGMDRNDAAEVLADRGLNVGKVTAVNTSDAQKNEVVSQSADPDTYVKTDSAIDIEVCVGDDNTIPDGTLITSDSGIITQEKSEDSELDSNYYYGSIDTSCVVGDANGPGSGNVIYVAVRLAQRVDGSVEYTSLSEPIPVSSGTRIPVSFKNIKGAPGVTEGTVEVYGVDNGKVYSSYVISFAPAA